MTRRGRKSKAGELGGLIGVIVLLGIGALLVEHAADLTILFAILWLRVVPWSPIVRA